MRQRNSRFISKILSLGLLIVSVAPTLTTMSVHAAGASLGFTPNRVEVASDSTFDLSLTLNTGGQSVNALEVYVSFPADKLQVVSPTTGSSFVSFWINGPSYSNTNGSLSFQGGLPNPGINTTAGIISTINFRAKSPGTATIRYQINSKILANDGAGTSIPLTFGQAIITIRPATPAGPVVSSSTHEDPGHWYSSPAFNASWTSPGGTDYSYVFDQLPTTTPDEVAETQGTVVAQTMTGDGQWFFHIRAKAGGVWGATTHYLFKVDNSPPASFTITTDSNSILSGQRGVFNFTTTDGVSGIAYYEARVVRLDGDEDAVTAFSEAVSPYQSPKLGDGRYRLVVRAVDTAGNVMEATLDFSVGVGGIGLSNGQAFLTNPLAINIIFISFIFLLLLLSILLIGRLHERRQADRAIAQVRLLQQEISRRRSDLQRLEGIYQQAVSPPPETLTERFQPGQNLTTQVSQGSPSTSRNERELIA